VSSKQRRESPQLLDRLRGRLGGLLGSAAARTGGGAARLREAARDLRQGPSLLSQALAARARGNLEAAFFLLQEAWSNEPDTSGVPTAFWDLSLALGRPRAAAPAAASLVGRCAEQGALELGVQYLAELGRAAPEAVVNPLAIARLLPALRERIDAADGEERVEAEALLRHALGLALDPRNKRPTPGLALRLFAEAREVDDGAARRAAELALESPCLHEAKRALLSDFLRGPPKPSDSEPRLVPADRPAPATVSSARGCPSEEVPAAPARGVGPHHDGPAPSPGQTTSMERDLFAVEPEELNDDALLVRRRDGSTSRIGWGEIEAVAVARIEAPGRETVTIVDLLFNWTRRDRETLRLMRLRDDGFDPARLVPSGEGSLADFLAEILERSRAIPLPDPESALGLRPVAFDSLDAYELAILGRPSR
jgi:hypothetical protein